MNNLGLFLAILGAALTVGLSGIGSARGVGLVGEAGAGLLSEDSSMFMKILVLELLPGTQGLYGLLTTVLCLSQLGVLGGEAIELTVAKGIAYFAACMPITIVGYFSAVAQGRTAISGVNIVAKNPTQSSKALTMAAMVETYAILALLVSILVINGLK